MGKGEISSEVGNGQYQVIVRYAGRTRINQWITTLDDQISALQAAIDAMEGFEKTIGELRIKSLQNRKAYVQNKMPEDFTVSAWCADLTTGLTGDVGTIEIPGERSDGLNIQPGTDGNAEYNSERDGQLLPAVATSAMASYFNRALLPGWQKWKPTYRYGTIVPDSLDFDSDTCSVCLDPAYSSQQNLDINRSQGFSSCEVTPPDGFLQFCTDNPTHPT